MKTRLILSIAFLFIAAEIILASSAQVTNTNTIIFRGYRTDSVCKDTTGDDSKWRSDMYPHAYAIMKTAKVKMAGMRVELSDSMDVLKTWAASMPINWTNVYGAPGFISAETDPVWLGDKSNYYTKSAADGRYLQSYTETEPLFSASPSAGITNPNISNWNTAFGWGDHAAAGYALATNVYSKTASDSRYLQSYTETDPLWSVSPSFGISSANISNWNTAFGWGNHASAGYALATNVYSKTASDGRYLQSYTESDPLWSASASAGISSANISNWNTSFGWGNHALAGYVVGNGTTGQYIKGDGTKATFPSIPAAQVNSDWNAGSGVAQILNKPAILRHETYSGTTNASGLYTVTYTTPYATVPNVQFQINGGTVTNSIRITSSTVNGFTLYVQNRVDVLGLLPSYSNVSGATVYADVFER